MDINSREMYPSSALSNFANNPFLFDEVICQTMEGLLQSLKFKDHEIQKQICLMDGRAAKNHGSESNWQKSQKLWWKGVVYDRHTNGYQKLLDRAFNTLAANDKFKQALLMTEIEELTHSIGESDERKTVLTEKEFCSRLMKIRERLRSQ